jgi:3-oxoacyl-ACP reductase-like protein
MKHTLTLALVSATLLLSACSKSEEAPAAPEAPAAATPAEAPAVAAAGTTGVPECDDMYAKIEKCMAEKVPEAQRGAMMDAFKQSKEQMVKMSAGNKDAMAKSCKASGDAMKQQYAAMGCTF